MKVFFSIIAVFAVLIGGFTLFKKYELQAPVIEQAGDTQEYADEKRELVAHAHLIRVDNLVPGQKVTAGITVTGEARGYWYFEASFPVEVQLPSGEVLVASYATAQSNWMTSEFVPFTSTITVPADKLTSGEILLVLKKDNPSGMPENDDSITIPLLLVK